MRTDSVARGRFFAEDILNTYLRSSVFQAYEHSEFNMFYN
jgi:hypothetical protein